MLATLEGRLVAAETGYPALVFYKLRGLWQSGREHITQFISDLVRQQEDHERRAHIAQHNRKGFARRQGAESQMRAAEGLNAVTAAQRLINERTGWAGEIKARVARLQTAARYRGDAYTAPLADSLAFSEDDVLALAALGAQAEKLPNVLAEDTWDLFRVLLR